MAALASTSVKAQVLTKWTFETSQPVTAGPFSPEIGSGSALGFHSGNGGTTTYSTPAGNGSSHSFSANGWAVGDYYQFQTSTLGDSGALSVSFDQTSSNTGPGQYQFGYSTDGVNFTSLGGVYTVLANAAPNAPWNATTSSSAYTLTYDLSSIVGGLDNQNNVYFRLTDAGTTSANGGVVAVAGTDRVDNFTLSMTAAPEPSTMALGLLGGLAVLGLRARRSRA